MAGFQVITEAQERTLAEGDKRYTPTRLEWLTYTMNARMRIELTDSSTYTMDFGLLPTKNTIVIHVRYVPNVNRELMNMSIETARDIISMDSSRQGWSSWLKVKEDIQMYKEHK